MLLSSNDFGKALRKICWGYAFIHIDLSLIGLDVLPSWIGYLLILFAIGTIAREEPSAALLRPFAIALSLISAAVFLCELLGVELDRYGILSVFHSLMWLYLQFQLLTNIAEMAKRRSYPKTKRILILRTCLALLYVIPAALKLFFDERWFVYAFAILYLFLVIWVSTVLISLRIYLWEHDEALDEMAERGELAEEH